MRKQRCMEVSQATQHSMLTLILVLSSLLCSTLHWAFEKKRETGKKVRSVAIMQSCSWERPRSSPA